MSVEERTFQIHLEGLIRLLAQNLYADPDIFLREMIQNAHDSIGRRAVLAAERGETERAGAADQGGGRPEERRRSRSPTTAAG